MIPFLVRRILALVPTLIGITLLTFLILNLLPADPLRTWSTGGPVPSAEARARLRAELRADEGPGARYLSWSLALLRGDLGQSLRDGRPVGQVVAEALPWTIVLNGCAILLIYGLAVPFGLLGGMAPGSAFDRLGSGLLLALYSLPSFAAALLLQEAFSVRLGLLPLQGTASAGATASVAGATLDHLRHLILPTVCLALMGWAFVARYARAAFRAVAGNNFIAVVRSKGLSRRGAARHIVANTAVSLLTHVAAIIPGLVGGSVIVEQVFSWPGLGRLYLSSIEGRDYPVVLGLTLLSAVAVLGGQFVVDLLYMAADPKLRDQLLGTEAGA